MRKAMQAGIVAAGFAAAFGFFGQLGDVPVALAAAAQPAAQTVGAGQAALGQALWQRRTGAPVPLGPVSAPFLVLLCPFGPARPKPPSPGRILCRAPTKSATAISG
mgnify:CR=1 FL=1